MRFWQLMFFTTSRIVSSWVHTQMTRVLPFEQRSRRRKARADRLALSIAKFFKRQEGIYIKAAQFLGSISNLFEENAAEQFAVISDKVEPDHFDKVRHRFITEFEQEPEELFAEFDRKAVAAASIGQVHMARLEDGREVIVKFLHAGLEHQLARDMRALRMAVRLIRFFYPYLHLMPHLQEFTQMVYAETDFVHEAENLRRFRALFDDDPKVVIPDVIADRSGKTVITMEFINGYEIGNIQALRQANIDLAQVSEIMLDAFVRMVFKYKFLHADPHGGNIIVVQGDALNPVKIGFIDFGAAITLPPSVLRNIESFIRITRDQNIQRLADLAVSMGLLRQEAEPQPYRDLFEIIHGRYAGFTTEQHYLINPLRFGRTVRMDDLHAVNLRLRDLIRDMRFPRNYIYLARVFTLIISIAQRLDENVNIFYVAKPYIIKHLGLTPRSVEWYFKRANWQRLVDRFMYNDANPPRDARAPAARMVDSTKMYHLGQQAIFATLAITSSILIAWFHTSGLLVLSKPILAIPAVFLALMFWKMRKRGN